MQTFLYFIVQKYKMDIFYGSRVRRKLRLLKNLYEAILVKHFCIKYKLHSIDAILIVHNLELCLIDTFFFEGMSNRYLVTFVLS